MLNKDFFFFLISHLPLVIPLAAVFIGLQLNAANIYGSSIRGWPPCKILRVKSKRYGPCPPTVVVLWEKSAKSIIYSNIKHYKRVVQEHRVLGIPHLPSLGNLARRNSVWFPFWWKSIPYPKATPGRGKRRRPEKQECVSILISWAGTQETMLERSCGPCHSHLLGSLKYLMVCSVWDGEPVKVYYGHIGSEK